MPLSYTKQPKAKLFPKVVQASYHFLQLIRPEILLTIFLLTAILLSFLQIQAREFYAVFGVFIAGYFIERAIKVWKFKSSTTQSEK